MDKIRATIINNADYDVIDRWDFTVLPRRGDTLRMEGTRNRRGTYGAVYFEVQHVIFWNGPAKIVLFVREVADITELDERTILI